MAIQFIDDSAEGVYSNVSHSQVHNEGYDSLPKIHNYDQDQVF